MSARNSYLAEMGRRHPLLAIFVLVALLAVATVLLLAHAEAPGVLYENF